MASPQHGPQVAVVIAAIEARPSPEEWDDKVRRVMSLPFFYGNL
jgi:hypothetical protein